MIYGSGSAREHATYVRLQQELGGHSVWFALAGCQGLLVDDPGVILVTGPVEAAERACELNIDLVLILGAVEILANMGEIFRTRGLPTFNTDDSVLHLERSKRYAKQMMDCWKVPTPRQWAFLDATAAAKFLEECWEQSDGRLVVKSDATLDHPNHRAYLPASLLDAQRAATLLATQYRQPILVEDRLFGPELSIHVLFDGESYVLLPPVQDYKRLNDGDTGPNTAGIGAAATTYPVDAALWNRIETEIVVPTLEGIQSLRSTSQLILYIGVILTDLGPKVLEYNVRSGSPEWLALLPLIETPLSEIVWHLAHRKLDQVAVRYYRERCGIVTALVGAGYPEPDREHSVPVTGVMDPTGSFRVFGESLRREGHTLMTGPGRVLMVSGSAASWQEARRQTQKCIEGIYFSGMYHRSDIGAVGLRLNQP
jgi:phosphoribosylamine--glycine ligase